jgi:hypothetical protein
MADPIEYRSVAFGVQIINDGADAALAFETPEGQQIGVIIGRDFLPSVLLEIQSNIGSATIVPISKRSLRPGTRIRARGHQIGPGPDGGKMLTIFAEVGDDHRVVTIPIDLPSHEVGKLVDDLSKL